MRAPRILTYVAPCPHGEAGTMQVRVVKGWWGGPGVGGRQRCIHEFCIPVPDGPESERVARCLEAAAAALRG